MHTISQILVQHIKAILPALKSHVKMELVAVAKEHASFGDTEESKDGLAVKLLNILAQYSEGDIFTLFFNLYFLSSHIIILLKVTNW
jgi:hypothetical protein